MGNKSNKILLVSPVPPPIGGIASWTVDYIEKMSDLQQPVCVVNSSVVGKRIDNTSKVSIFDEIKRLFNIRNEIKREVKLSSPSVIHYNASCFTMGLIRDYLVLCTFWKRVPVVYQCHCNLETNVNNKLSRFLFKRISANVKLVLALNKKSARFAKEFTKDVDVIPNFIKSIPEKRITISNELKNIVFVGRVTVEKGINELLELAKKCPQYTIHIVGPDSSGLLEDNKLDNVIVYGEKTHEQVLEIICKQDALILPSYSEGFPLVIMEGMAVGLPILATPVGSIPDMIEDKGGVLFGVGDIDSMICAIEKMSSRSVREGMASFNNAKVREKYSSDIVLKNLIQIYKNIGKEI